MIDAGLLLLGIAVLAAMYFMRKVMLSAAGGADAVAEVRFHLRTTFAAQALAFVAGLIVTLTGRLPWAIAYVKPVVFAGAIAIVASGILEALLRARMPVSPRR